MLIFNVGHHDQLEVAGRVVYLLKRKTVTFHSERPASFGNDPGGHVDGMEACFG